MRRFLFIICILSITIGAKAQLFNGRLSTTVAATAKTWEAGSYYDSEGSKHSGFINWEVPVNNLLKGSRTYVNFKSDKDEKSVRLFAKDIRCFIVGEDSVIVSNDSLVSKSPFLRVLVSNNDTTKLYEYVVGKQLGATNFMTTSAVSSSVAYLSRSYFFGSNPDKLTRLTKKNFIEVMSRIMADKPEAVARIKAKKLRYGNMDEVLYFYKYDIMPPAPAPDPFSGLDH